LDVTVENSDLVPRQRHVTEPWVRFLRLNGRTSANIQAEGAQIYRLSHGEHATDPQLRKVHLILQA
jgi:hypothetical protein